MLLTFDRTDFPMLALENLQLEMHLLPITKWQFEQFLAQSERPDRAAYRQMVALNPGLEAEQELLAARERLFVTGILPNEALAFVRWLGQGFDLPTVKEWRAIYKELRHMYLPQHGLGSELVGGGPAGRVLDAFSARLEAITMQEYCLMRRGVVEWVRRGQEWVGLGAPRPQFHPNLWDPASNSITPLRPDERLPYFGFRPVRRGEWYLSTADKVRYVH